MMKKYIFRRLLLVFPTLFFVTMAVFFLIHLIPGHPAEFILGEKASPSEIARLSRQLHLNDNVWVQFSYFLVSVFKLDLGYSLFHQHMSVLDLILMRLPATFLLACSSMCIALCISLPLGLYSAVKKDTLQDHLASLVALLGVSMPNFYLGPLLIYFFSLHYNWLPASGFQSLWHLILPSFTLGTALAAILTRMTRASVLDVLKLDYIRVARAKGLSQIKVYIKHALRSSLLSIVTLIGLQFGTLLAGSVVTEKVFAWPGLGTLLLDEIQRRNYPVVQGVILFIAFSYIAVNLVTDLLYARLDPRVKLG